MIALEYKRWDKFNNVINNAKISCEKSNNIISDHFSRVGRMAEIGTKTSRNIMDFRLSRYACYLIVQNADPRKETVALGQTYFAIQTRKQGNYTLQKVASSAGVKNMVKFHNAGYKGLYNEETADDIFKRKKLRYREDILDNMNEDELVANLFRINQTKQRLIKDNVQGEKEAKDVHYEVGKKVRRAIADIGGMMPEEMPTPKKSLKELERENKQLETMEKRKSRTR